MTPHLVKWHEEFSAQGLTIVEIDDGRIDTYEDLRSHARDATLPFAVLHDARGEVTARYGIGAYPTAYLLDADGRVLWEGHPSGQDRWRIKEALEKARG
jgi:peroxiredoxin